jgi:hypothetical protein
MQCKNNYIGFVWVSNFQKWKFCKIVLITLVHNSQVGFLKKSSFKKSSGILLVFSSIYLFTLFQGLWIQKSMLAIRKMLFNVAKWQTKWLPKKTTFENKPFSALFINGPYESRNVGIKLYFRYQLFFLSISYGITPL